MSNVDTDSDHYFQKAFNKALKYLNFRAKTKKELHNYLLKKKIDPQVAHKVIKKLTEMKLLNDKEYTESFFRTHQEYKGKSRYFIIYELKQKGIDEDLIKEVLENSQEDLKTARDFIERKRRVYSKLNDLEFKEKMMRLLSSRGFSFDIITQALKESQKAID